MRVRPPRLVSPSGRRHVSPSEALIAAAVLATLAVSAPSQQQFGELGKSALPVGGGTARAVVLGDVDGDGDLDVVVGTGGFVAGQQNQLYLNDGRGSYTDVTATHMPIDGEDTRAVALGDVDGDGDLDMVLGNYGDYFGADARNRLYLNDGTGIFTDVTTTQIPGPGDWTLSVALGDVDGDGDLDIVFGNVAPGAQNRIHLNDGTGVYTDATATRMPADSDPTSAVALGDVDGDSDLDIVFGNLNRQNRLYLNDGSGSYTDVTPNHMPIDNDSTADVALGDVDGDGDLDMVLGNLVQQNRLYLNTGAGFYNNATAARMPAAVDNTNAVSLGDVDGDGDLDMVVGNYAEQNRLYLNDGTGTYTDMTAARMPVDSDATQAVALDDVDGDGDLDIVFGNRRQNRLYRNNGTGTYTDVTAGRMPLLMDDNTSAVALGDVDGDGDLDMVVGNYGRQNQLYLNDGYGFYTDVTAARMPAALDVTRAVALGDVDGDGDLDIVFGNFFSQQNRLYLNDGAGFYTDATAAHMPVHSDGTRAVALGDVAGDGDLDMVTGNLGAQFGTVGEQNRLYLNDGSGFYTDATDRMQVDTDSTHALALGDVDGDGDLDIVTANLGRLLGNVGEQNRLYVNNGAGFFTEATAAMPRADDRTGTVALGDVDGDGDLDIVFGNGYASFGQQNVLYLNDGAGSYTNVTAAHMPVDTDRTYALELGDVDGDGDLDMVLGNRVQQNRLYVNTGTGFYTDVTAARMPVDRDLTEAVALGDVDGGGDPDIVFANHRGTDRLYLNLLRQLDAPFPLQTGQTYTLDAYARYGPPSTMDVALPFLATAPASIPLPPFGTLGLNPTQMVSLRPILIPQPAGVGSLSFFVPNVPRFVGISIYTQALVVPLPFQGRLTNATADVIQ